jgi:drug/metabolite transporter, DME family
MSTASQARAQRQVHPFRGYLYIGSAALLWGICASLGRAAFTGRSGVPAVDPLILAQCRTTFSFLIFLPTIASIRGLGALRLPIRDFLYLAAIGIFGVAASNYFYYLAIQKTNVATAIIVQYTAPAWVLLYTVARGAQRATWPRVVSVVLALIGVAMVIGMVGSGGLRLNSIGVAAAILAAFSFTFYNIGGHAILTRYDRWIVLLHTTGTASAFWLIVNPPWRVAAQHYSSGQWIFLFVFSLLSVLAPFSFYFAGLQHLEPTRAVVTSCLEPVFSILIAAVALGETVHAWQAVGILLVLAAILVVQLPEPGRQAVNLVEPVE